MYVASWQRGSHYPGGRGFTSDPVRACSATATQPVLVTHAALTRWLSGLVEQATCRMSSVAHAVHVLTLLDDGVSLGARLHVYAAG